jgi:hypothetical protein
VTQPLFPTLSQELTLRCLDQAGRSLDLATSLGYDPADPYAVWFTFRAEGGDVRWAICRHTLLLGLTDPAGRGDVQIWPGVDEAGRGVVVLEFQSPAGRLIALAPTQDVHHFLVRTLAAVPAGTEGAHLDLDGLVNDLLGRSHPQ